MSNNSLAAERHAEKRNQGRNAIPVDKLFARKKRYERDDGFKKKKKINYFFS
jgi:hypothetical protein